MKTKQNNIRPRDEPSGRSRKPVKKVNSRQSPKQNMNPLERAFTKLAKAFVKKGGTKIIATYFPYVMFAYFGNKIGFSYRVAKAPDFFNRMMEALQNLGGAFTNIFPSIHPFDLIIGIITGIGMYFVVFFKKKNAKKFRKGVEYGSARWGTEKDIDPFMDHENSDNNIILTQTEGIIMNGKPKGPQYDRNKNVMVIGGSGSGKTRFFVKPNLMQLHSSYCVTDPKGTILLECGRMFQKAGYEIKVLNTINFRKSMHYNPFSYIHDEKDILKLVNTLIVNTKGEGQQATEDFWVKAERLLYQAYIGYIFYECVEDEQNFTTLIDMINASETKEEDESYENAIDLIFKELEEYDPEHFAVKQYKKYKLAAGKTAKSILISCGARLAPFDIKELRELTEYDEMELDKMGERRTAMFLIMSDTDATFNFILAILQSQMFNILCECADDKHGGRLPVPVRFLLDEFANIGQIPQFEKLIATIRSRGVSASIILQSKSQLKAMYKDNADTIEGNCDAKVFLGGSEKTTLKDLSELLGKETIDMYNITDTRGMSPSYGTNYQKTGKDLLSQDEIAVMDRSKCIAIVSGVRPFLSKKYDITKHKRYKELSDYDEKNTFDVEAFLSTKLKMKKTDTVESYDLGIINR